jgi:hypothetical protein
LCGWCLDRARKRVICASPQRRSASPARCKYPAERVGGAVPTRRLTSGVLRWYGRSVGAWDPVPLEYSIVWLTCAVTCGLDANRGWLAGCCSRSSTCWFAGYSASRSWCSARTWPRMLSCWPSGTRTRAAPERRADTVRAGRPGVVRCASAADTPSALGRGLPRDASDAAGLAPSGGCEKVRHEQTAQARPPAGNSQHRPPGERESAVGLPPDPRRADQARPHNRGVHRL